MSSTNWQCQVDNLSPIAYRKYQYTSLYNPLQDLPYSKYSTKHKSKYKYRNQVIYQSSIDPIFKYQKSMHEQRLPLLKVNHNILREGKNIDGCYQYYSNRDQKLDVSQHKQQRNKLVNNNKTPAIDEKISKKSLYKNKQNKKLHLKKQKLNPYNNKPRISSTKNEQQKQNNNQNAQKLPNPKPTTTPPTTTTNTNTNIIQITINSFNNTKSTLNTNTNTNNNKQFAHRFNIFKANMNRLFTKLGERDRQFSYNYHFLQQIYAKIQNSAQKQQTIQQIYSDIVFLLHKTHNTQNNICINTNPTTNTNTNTNTNINTSISMKQYLSKLLQFRKNQNYFQSFKTSQILILFHIVIVELQIYQEKLEQAILELEFCQYYSRKQEFNNLVICYFWESIHISISLLRYQQADLNVRNIMQIAIISHRQNILQYLLQKISLLYYYRGNSIMCKYYKTKSQQGLTQFQLQMYTKQYSKQDQINRLQHKLFNYPIHYKQITKYKNNPKIQYDIWKQAKLQHQNNIKNYMNSINNMMKDYQYIKESKNIRNIKNMKDYQVQYKKMDTENNHNHYNRSKYKRFTNTNRSCHQQSSIYTNDNPISQKLKIKLRYKYKQKQRAQQNTQIVQQNITQVIKTHLSMNRQNNSQNKQKRLKKFIHFIYMLQSQLKEICSMQNET